MGRGERTLTEASRPEDNVVSLGVEPPDPAPSGSRSMGRMHGLAIGGMALCAFVGILSMLAFITVSWPGSAGRYVITVLVTSVFGFMACATIAVFSAARATYPHQKDPSRDENRDH